MYVYVWDHSQVSPEQLQSIWSQSSNLKYRGQILDSNAIEIIDIDSFISADN